MQQKLAHKVMCIGEHVTGIVGCFGLYPCTQFTSLYYKYIKTTQLCVGVCVCVCVCVCECARAIMFVIFSRMMLMHINVKIFTTMRYRPLT